MGKIDDNYSAKNKHYVVMLPPLWNFHEQFRNWSKLVLKVYWIHSFQQHCYQSNYLLVQTGLCHLILKCLFIYSFYLLQRQRDRCNSYPKVYFPLFKNYQVDSGNQGFNLYLPYSWQQSKHLINHWPSWWKNISLFALIGS